MSRRTLLTALGGIAVAAALAAGSALPAAADPASSPSASPASGAAPTTPASPCAGSTAAVLACIKQRAAVAISDRETALQKMAADLNSSRSITASDRSTLLGQISLDESGLQSLGTTIQNDATVKQARSDARTIVTGYRVYVLEGPKVHLVIAADTEAAAEARIQNRLPAVQSAIDHSGASAAEKQAAQQALDDCISQLAAAKSASSGVSATVIDLQPSGYPGNQSILAGARGSVSSARADLGKCRTDLDSIRKDLGG
jgi:3D (Asp-Asp-Asp) domain-containing protein